MDDKEFIRDAKYWADKLEETTKNLKPFLEKTRQIPVQDLTYSEMLELGRYLGHATIYSNLLSEAVAKHSAPTETKPFWKNLFQK